MVLVSQMALLFLSGAIFLGFLYLVAAATAWPLPAPARSSWMRDRSYR